MTHPTRRSHYQVLYVRPDAPDAVINAAYRALLQTRHAHPHDPDSRQLHEAYAVLSDPSRRAQYDRQLADATAAHCQSAATQRPSPALSACPFCDTPVPTPSAGPRSRRCPSCASPLSTPPAARRLNATRRAFERQPMAATVEYFLRGGRAPRAARLHDFSPRGARLTADERLPLDTLMALKTPLFDALARVVDCRPSASHDRYELGVEFITLALTAPAGSLLSIRA